MKSASNVTKEQIQQLVGWTISGLRGGPGHMLLQFTSPTTPEEHRCLRLENLAGFLAGRLVGEIVRKAQIGPGSSYAIDLSLRQRRSEVADWSDLIITVGETEDRSGLRAVFERSTFRPGTLGNEM